MAWNASLELWLGIGVKHVVFLELWLEITSLELWLEIRSLEHMVFLSSWLTSLVVLGRCELCSYMGTPPGITVYDP